MDPKLFARNEGGAFLQQDRVKVTETHSRGLVPPTGLLTGGCGGGGAGSRAGLCVLGTVSVNSLQVVALLGVPGSFLESG